jgi:Transposase DDE domain
MTTKILSLIDALGNLVRFELLPGHRYDNISVPPLIDGVDFGALIADKAFDSNAIVADLNDRGAKIVISQHPRRIRPLLIDARDVYKWRQSDPKTSFANSRNSNASRCAPTKPTKASEPSSISSPPS